MDTIRRWAISILIVVLVVIVIFGGLTQVVIAVLYSGDQQQSLPPFIIAALATYAVVIGIITVMQSFGISPLDLLPERNLEERLRRQDRNRFIMSGRKDILFLAEQTRAAKNQKQFEWVYLYANAWLREKPHEPKALEYVGEALIKLNRPKEAIPYGEKLIEIRPLQYDGHSLLGDAYRDLGELEKARGYYEHALQIATPDFKQTVLSDLVDVYKSLGQTNNAINAIRELLPLLDNDWLRSHYQKDLDHLEQLKR